MLRPVTPKPKYTRAQWGVLMYLKGMTMKEKFHLVKTFAMSLKGNEYTAVQACDVAQSNWEEFKEFVRKHRRPAD